MIEELPSWKSFVTEYIFMVRTNSLDSRSPNNSNSMSKTMVGMLYNTKCLVRMTSALPKEGTSMWKSNICREVMYSIRVHFLARPRGVVKLEDVVVGLQGFINYWQ